MNDFIRVIKDYKVWLLFFSGCLLFLIPVERLKGAVLEVEILLFTVIFTLLITVITIDHDNNSWLSNKKYEYLEKIIYSTVKYEKIIERCERSQSYDYKVIKDAGKDLIYSLDVNICLLKTIEEMSKSDYQGFEDDMDKLVVLDKLLEKYNDSDSNRSLTYCKSLLCLINGIIKNCQSQMKKCSKITAK